MAVFADRSTGRAVAIRQRERRRANGQSPNKRRTSADNGRFANIAMVL